MIRARAQHPIGPSQRTAATPTESPLASTVADRLKRLIAKKGRSFERLAALSGIASDELLRIEAGAETPTINHLWRIANALGIPFGSLIASKGRRGVLVIRNDHPQIVSSRDGNCRTRALFPYNCHRPVEFYEVILAPHHIQHAEAHAPGTKENLVIAKGSVEVAVGREAPERLAEGDAIDFLADVPHSYRNLGATPATFYLVMSYEPGSGTECAS
jgi:transcriptional regulator with XRE-family HTH domain